MKIFRITLLLLLICSTSFAVAEAKAAKKPLIVFVTGDHEYSSELTMPLIAAELEKHYGMQTVVLKASPDQNAEENIPGLEILKKADVAVFFLRWRRLPAEQVKYIEDYLRSGKPVMGFRTSSHAFNYPAGHPLEKWNDFGEFALNAPPGWEKKGNHTHYGHLSTTEVSVIPAEVNKPILTGVKGPFTVPSWLYRVLPDYPVKGSTWLLMGHAINPDKPATDQPVAWMGNNSFGGKVFMTTLGHPQDFEAEPFQRLVINAIHWAAGKPVPREWKGRITMNIQYDQHPQPVKP
ncbi:hypothetical protein D0C36_00060 [Mucilaginibacter conchicola]|uniref:ThuA-like domain-containing protein n=1 Tax=Mucilaginibacter conchicola TaxID=2303333 RepID=A0A372NV69_9SPHI|nr:ThuA domain-containing protein [Mucilaginibacter conchicola]RFZ93995.1 hypothetical protein D0C36_00060 [Mucilaginibacter conchicola]